MRAWKPLEYYEFMPFIYNVMIENTFARVNMWSGKPQIIAKSVKENAAIVISICAIEHFVVEADD